MPCVVSVSSQRPTPKLIVSSNVPASETVMSRDGPDAGEADRGVADGPGDEIGNSLGPASALGVGVGVAWLSERRSESHGRERLRRGYQRLAKVRAGDRDAGACRRATDDNDAITADESVRWVVTGRTSATGGGALGDAFGDCEGQWHVDREQQWVRLAVRDRVRGDDREVVPTQ